jgi:hypothetical protein
MKKKLVFNKVTISNIGNSELMNVRGGWVDSEEICLTNVPCDTMYYCSGAEICNPSTNCMHLDTTPLTQCDTDKCYGTLDIYCFTERDCPSPG